jgi:hypothetical protein
MAKTDFKEIIKRSKNIRKLYHQLEQQYHESEWTVEEDALAFLTDAGLVGRLKQIIDNFLRETPLLAELQCAQSPRTI